MDRLVTTYPQVIEGHDGKHIIWRDGTMTPFDDGNDKKDFQTRLNEPDLEDQFDPPYRTGPLREPPAKDHDPGRIRFEPLFLKIYGDCRKDEVRNKLVKLTWLPKKAGRTIQITSANGVSTQLAKVSEELDKLPARFDKFIINIGGTYNCRKIAGTDRLSVHSFGAAIDLNPKFSNYWRWTKKTKDGLYIYQNHIPWEIVDIFERHGFIWGGKWYHFDTMHFEYRPELIQDKKNAG